MHPKLGRDFNLAATARYVLPRGVALFLGAFSLVNVLGEFWSPGFDANLWWVDLRWLSPILARTVLLLFGVGLVAFGLRPPRSGLRRWLFVGCVGGMGIAAVVNTMQFYLLLARGAVHAEIPVPLSLGMVVALALILAASLRKDAGAPGRQSLFPVLSVGLACGFAFPLLQMFCFGKTDYRRPADVAVVLGARAYADGRPSDALADRVRTACQLYHQGLARKLIFSGGPGDGAIHETESMKRLAVRLGVRPEDILVDEAGLNTQATVKNTEALFQQLHASRVLVVSHFYHLPRIKLSYQRTGWEVFTVPAKESYLLRQTPFNLLREVAALWVYYLRG